MYSYLSSVLSIYYFVIPLHELVFLKFSFKITSSLLLLVFADISMSFTVSCIVCWVTFNSNICMEPLLGGGVGFPLEDGKASSVPVTVLIVFISEVSWPSKVCNLLETMSLILKISPFCSLNSFIMGLKPLTLECTLYICHKT